MTPSDSYSGFCALLKAQQLTLKSLTVPDAVRLMFDFYRDQLEGVSPRMGDGMAYATEIVDRRGRTPFELSIVRLLTTSDEVPAPNGSRLRLSLGFRWLEAVGWFAQPDHGIPHGSSLMAWSPDAAEALRRELEASRINEVLSAHPPRSVELRHEPIWGAWG
jgi:hypothetical protein